MPPRSQPKIHQIQMRTHKLSIMVTVPPSTTIATLKEEALSALTSPVNKSEEVPTVESENDFELCKAVKQKGQPTFEYEVLDVFRQVRECGLASYDSLYLQFRDSSGNLLPVTTVIPSIDDEDEPPSEADFPISSVTKGKRKAHFD